jgi:hypothetical protein
MDFSANPKSIKRQNHQYITTNNQTWNPPTDYFQMDRHLGISGTNSTSIGSFKSLFL